MNRPAFDKRPSDETLLAFADGMLPADAAEAVARYIAHDAEARALVENFKVSGALISAAYDDILDAPVPDHLTKAIMDRPLSAAPDNVVPLRRRTADRLGGIPYLAPLAACLLLAVGAMAGHWLARSGNPSTDGIQVAIGSLSNTTALARLLEEGASNTPVALRGGAESIDVMVVATFLDRNGRACREFEVTRAADASPSSVEGSREFTAAIACRGAKGEWSIEGAFHLAGGQQPSLGEFNPASGQSFSAIEGVLKAMGASPALSQADEKAAIDRRWAKIR